uniref:Uncharacterized protein n=1 Tax=Esox lucius TaxID=8010 RepID=A0A6Q2X7G4_ESOLU
QDNAKPNSALITTAWLCSKSGRVLNQDKLFSNHCIQFLFAYLRSVPTFLAIYVCVSLCVYLSGLPSQGVSLWEVPPNGQGMAALMALNILENFPIKEMGHNSANYLHVLAEALKLSLADTVHYLSDPDHVNVPPESLLSKDYSLTRSHTIHMDRSNNTNFANTYETGSDRVYFTVADRQGNACSFVNSNYMGFGTGLVPQGCGFSLQVSSSHIAEDLIESVIKTQNNPALQLGILMSARGNPAGNLHSFFSSHSPTIAQQWCVNLEQGVDQSVFGRGQVISVGDLWNLSTYDTEPAVRVLWAGSDPRADGCAQGY